VFLVLRIVWTFAYPVEQSTDYGEHYAQALSFAGMEEGTGNPIRTIGQSLLAAPILALSGGDVRAIGILNAILSGAALVMLYASTRRIFGVREALAAGCVALCGFSELLFNNLLCTEIPAALAGLAMLFLLSDRAGGRRRLILLGLVGGIATYFRANLFVMGAASLLVFDLACRRGLRSTLQRALLVQLCTTVVVLPLCFHYAAFGRFTPFPATFGRNLWISNNPYLREDPFRHVPGWHVDAQIPELFPVGSAERRQVYEAYSDFHESEDPDLDYDDLDAFQSDDLFRRYATGWILGHPAAYLRLIPARFVFLFFDSNYGSAYYRPGTNGIPETPAGRFAFLEWFRVFSERTYHGFMIGAVLSLALCIVRHGRRFWSSIASLPLILVCLQTLPYVLFHAVNRYNVPMLGFFWIYLGYGLLQVGAWARSRLAPSTG
jgi:hypothetical protein